MDQAFYSIYADLRLFVFITNDATRDSTKTSLQKRFRKLIVDLNQADEKAKHLFIDLHNEQLLIFKDLLLQPGLDFRSLHDQLFTKLIKLNPKPPTITTQILEKFIQGITYFQDQNRGQRVPIYHRLASCGPGTETFRKMNNQCHDGQNKKKRAENKQAIERCYIERLVFDEIYKRIELFLPGEEVSQDHGHLHWLDEETKGDFESCFPNVKIKILVDFTKHLRLDMPSALTIIRVVAGSHKSTTKYIKNTILEADGSVKYGIDVDCIKNIENQNGTTSSWYKLQSFSAMKKTWKRVGP